MSDNYGPRTNRKVAETFHDADTPPSQKKVNTSFWTTVEKRKELRILAAELGTTYSALLEEGGDLILRKYKDRK